MPVSLVKNLPVSLVKGRPVSLVKGRPVSLVKGRASYTLAPTDVEVTYDNSDLVADAL